ncbi:MAG: hypothetical protein A4E35_00223 [Methanoregula sp. PtaU1.Bin051]|nr:MAG: hypothetical protein A4E35_00223 [Methanoregula sp. PtaU1.Bin051]
MPLLPNQYIGLAFTLTLLFGALTLVSLLTTATLGVLVLKGKYDIPFPWHPRMAAVTIVFAIVHVTLIVVRYF